MERSNYWTRRLGRRRLLAASATTGVGAASFALVGCGDDDDDEPSGGETPTGGTSTSASGNTPSSSSGADAAREKSTKSEFLKIRQQAPYASINPWKGLDSGGTWCWWIFDHLFYTPFDTLKPELMLATAFENPDPTTFTFKLGESQFHNKAPINGRKVLSTDVKASYEESRIQPGVSQTTFSAAIFDRIDTPDDQTCIVKLNTPYGWWNTTDGLAAPINGSIVPEEFAKDPNKMDTDLIGSQRFEFVSHQNGANFKMKRSETWREKPEPYLAGIDYVLLQEQAAAIAAFSDKQVDSLVLNNKLEADQLRQKHGDDIDIVTEQSRSVWTVQTRADGPYADPRVRQAFSYALNRQEIIDTQLLGDGAMSGPVAPAFKTAALPESELKDTLFKFDPAEAKKLLEAANFPMDREIEIKYVVLGDNFSKYAQVTSAQIEKNLGLKTKLVAEDLGKWLQQSLYGGDYKDLIEYPCVAYEQPSTYVIMFTKEIGGRPNWANFMDDELTAMVAKADSTIDDDDRLQQYQELQRKAIEKWAPLLTTHVGNSHTAYWNYLKDSVRGRGSYGLFNGKLYIDKS